MKWTDNRLCSLFEIDHPIIQAPMAGATTPEMAAAASNAGAIGSLGCAMYSAEKLREVARATQNLTNRAINLNFFVHAEPSMDPAKAAAASAKLKPWYERLDAGDMPDPVPTHFPFDAQVCDAVLEVSPKVASFHFGLPDETLVASLKAQGTTILSSATTVTEAQWLEARGVDAIIAQGYEAGGHSGWFLPRGPANTAGTMALVPRMVDAVSVPVIAAGGITDGRGIAAALMLGAAGVQVGTAFLATPECAVSAAHKQALLTASGDDTMISKAFSGRNARSLVNEFASEMDTVTDWPEFPLMNTLTGPIRRASAKQTKPDAIALWSGQAVGLMREETTTQVVERLVVETKAELDRSRVQ